MLVVLGAELLFIQFFLYFLCLSPKGSKGSRSHFVTLGCFFTQGAALSHLEAPRVFFPAVRVAGNVAKHFSEPGGHEVVEDGVDGGAQVEENSRDDVDMLEDPAVLLV